MSRRPAEQAQATVEFVGTLPLLVLGAMACVQAVLVACSLLFAQSAADRVARGAERDRALASVPSAWRSRTRITHRGSEVSVRIRPPAVLPGASSVLRVVATSREAST